MQIAVIGTGYVGLVAGAAFADFGNDVICVDVDKDKIARMTFGCARRCTTPCEESMLWRSSPNGTNIVVPIFNASNP